MSLAPPGNSTVLLQRGSNSALGGLRFMVIFVQRIEIWFHSQNYNSAGGINNFNTSGPRDETITNGGRTLSSQNYLMFIY